MAFLWAVLPARLVGRGAVGMPARLVPGLADGPPGLMRWVSPEPEDWGSRWGCGRGGVPCRGAGRWWYRSGQPYASVWGGLRVARARGPPSAGLVCRGVGGAPGGPVLPLPGGLPAGGRMWTRRVVFGVAELGRLWGPGVGRFAGVRCQGFARHRCLLPPYFRGWARFPSRQVTPGAPGSLWLRGVVAGVVVPPVWMHVLVGGSVACRPPMVPERS